MNHCHNKQLQYRNLLIGEKLHSFFSNGIKKILHSLSNRILLKIFETINLLPFNELTFSLKEGAIL